MHQSRFYFLLLGVFLMLTCAQAKKCPAGEHWLKALKKCSIIDRVVTDAKNGGKCPSGLIPYGKSCVKLGNKPIGCPMDQGYVPKTKRCADWLFEKVTAG